VAPGLRAAACGDRCAPGLYWPCGGGARAGALFAKGDAQPGGEDGPCSWERLDQGAIWMALRTRRAGMIKGRHGLPGDPEWVAQGLDEPGLGSANALIGGQGAGRLDGVAALGDDVRGAPMVVAEAGGQRGAPGAWGSCEGGPGAQAGTDHGGLGVLEPLEPLRARGLQGAREVVGEADGVVDAAAAVCDALGTRAPGAVRGVPGNWHPYRDRPLVVDGSFKVIR
jgi:hypothetical protein